MLWASEFLFKNRLQSYSQIVLGFPNKKALESKKRNKNKHFGLFKKPENAKKSKNVLKILFLVKKTLNTEGSKKKLIFQKNLKKFLSRFLILIFFFIF